MGFRKYQTVEKVEPLKREDLPAEDAAKVKPKLASIKPKS